MLLSGCGPSGDSAPAAAPATTAAAIDASSPAPSPAQIASAPPAELPPVPATVELREADLEVRPSEDARFDTVWTAMTVEGVETVTAVRHVDATLVTLDADRAVTVAGVDPSAFRPFTPELTAQTPAVWERLQAGDALLRHDVAHELDVELGGTVLLVTESGSVEVRVGAFASNGAPPVADIVVPWEVGEALGQDQPTLLLVDVGEGESASEVGQSLVKAIGGGAVAPRQKPSEQRAQLRASGGSVRIDAFSYTSVGDGTIVIDPNWVRDWIVRVDLPRVGRVYVNRIIAPQLIAAMAEVEAKGLLDHFDPAQFAGGWVARHIDWNPRKPLSMHAWGLAVDFNSRDNCLGCSPKMDMEIVRTFEKWGFAWGGWWSRPDGMHFELAKVVTPS